MCWQDTKGFTALQLAAKNRHVETVAKLLDSAGTKEEKGYTALHLAVQAGNQDLVRQLLALPACDPSAKDVDGLTALHWAASKGEPLHISLVHFTLHVVLDCSCLTVLHLYAFTLHHVSLVERVFIELIMLPAALHVFDTSVPKALMAWLLDGLSRAILAVLICNVHTCDFCCHIHWEHEVPHCQSYGCF